MIKIILILFISLFFFIKVIFSQDSIITKSIHTKNFDLTTEYLEKVLNRNGIIKKEFKEMDYTNCNSILQLTDSSFILNHSSGKNLLLYKDIKEISFQGKSRMLEGIIGGALAGAVTGGLISAIFYKQWSKGSKFAEGGGGFFLIYESAFILTGGIIGGVIGYSYETESYDLTKYNPDKRKNEALKIFFKYQLNF